ncbi:MAG: hypothetical protein QOD12_2977, partial [Verrucomicrobiota bacterium]
MAFRFKVGEDSRRELMSVRSLALSLCFLGALAPIARAQAVVEGRVELPISRSAPVMSKRYEIVTKGGVLATSPPLAVVYLEGAFPKKAAAATKQVAQKDLTFIPALLPVRVGTRVEFPNEDDTYHNIFSY